MKIISSLSNIKFTIFSETLDFSHATRAKNPEFQKKLQGYLSKATATLALSTLLACASDNSQGVTPESPTPAPSVSSPATPAPVESPANPAIALAPGEYCYEAATDSLDAVIRLTVAEDGQVTGNSVATISDEANGYYSSYRQMLEGVIRGNELPLTVTTEIELDVQTQEETWILEGDRLSDGRTTFDLVECATVADRFAGTTTTTEATSPVSSAVNVHTKQVSFAPGTSSTVVSNAVVRGDRDVYLLNAREGQTMELSIKALENNAVFDVLAPDGQVLLREGTEAAVVLPQSGDYQVVVGGTRGNASYDLSIAIR